MWIFISLPFLILGAIIGLDIRRNRRRDIDDDLEAARLRLLAAGEDVDGTGGGNTPGREGGSGGNIYVSASVAVVDMGPPDDVRIIRMTTDPAYTAEDVTTAVEHVAPGVGSLASFAATVEDTRMRTSAQVRELEAAEIEAYAEAPAQEERLYYAAFELRWQAMLTDFEVGTRAVRRANTRHHASVGENTCVLCMVGVQEISDEFRQIVTRVESTDTGEISRADLNRMLART